MAVDLRWDLLTNSSANLGNALVQGAGQIAQRRETSRDRGALRNYLNNPNDKAAFGDLAERDPQTAFALRDEQLQQVRQLRADQREQLQFVGRLVRGVQDEAGWQQARQLAGQAGIDLTGVPETFDPAYVGQLQALDRALNRADPVRVGENERLIDPETGREIARGVTRRRWHAIQPGGRLAAEPDAPGDNAGAGFDINSGEILADGPNGEVVRWNPQTNQWEPYQGGAGPAAAPQTFP